MCTMGKTNLAFHFLLIVVYVSVIVQASFDSERFFDLAERHIEEEQRAIELRKAEEFEELVERFLDREERGTCEFKCPGGTVAILYFIFVSSSQGYIYV